MVKQLAWHQLPHKDVRVSLSSGQKSHTQVFCWSILDSCPRVRRPQKQAADPPQAGLNWDSGSQTSLVKCLSIGKGPQSLWELARVHTSDSEGMSTQAVLATNRKNYMQQQWREERVLNLLPFAAASWRSQVPKRRKEEVSRTKWYPWYLHHSKKSRFLSLWCAVERRHKIK